MKHGLWCGRTLPRGSCGPPRAHAQSLTVAPTCIAEHVCSKNLEFPFAKGKKLKEKLRLTKIHKSAEPFLLFSMRS